MSKDTKFFLGVVAGAIVVLGGLLFVSKGSKPTSGGSNHTYGPDNAKVKIVEYADFECPACGYAAPELRKAAEANATTVQVTFRHFPLPGHANARLAAQASEAASNQSKFWEMYDLLFAKQSEWANVSDPTNIFLTYAKALSLDDKKFSLDLVSAESKSIVDTDDRYSQSLGIDQTPTFYLNGQKLTGAKTAAEWQTLIDAAAK